jgi:hypothetical protein
MGLFAVDAREELRGEVYRLDMADGGSDINPDTLLSRDWEIESFIVEVDLAGKCTSFK